MNLTHFYDLFILIFVIYIAIVVAANPNLWPYRLAELLYTLDALLKQLLKDLFRFYRETAIKAGVLKRKVLEMIRMAFQGAKNRAGESI